MYRQEYPSAPNLFHRGPVHRFARPTLRETWQRNKVTSVVGLAMIVAGLVGLFHNEGRAVQTIRSLEEGRRKVVVPETNDVVFEENNDKLVFVADQLSIPDALDDSTYGISIQAVRLRKVVQMYQWHEIEDRRGSEAVAGAHVGDHDGHVELSYSYDRDWFDYLIDSDAFDNPMGHHNPEFWPINATTVTNPRVKLGGFLLGSDLKQKFDKDEYFTVFTSDERPLSAPPIPGVNGQGIKMHAGLYFHAEDVWKPEVGDIRIQFSYAGRDKEQITVVGRQSGREIRPFQTEGGDELLLLHYGLRKVSEVFQFEHAQNRLHTWMYRILGWLATFIGFNMISDLLDIIVDDNPVVRRAFVLRFGSLAFSFSLSTTMFTTAIGWISYRPQLGLGLLFVASLPFSLASVRIVQRREQERRRRL